MTSRGGSTFTENVRSEPGMPPLITYPTIQILLHAELRLLLPQRPSHQGVQAAITNQLKSAQL